MSSHSRKRSANVMLKQSGSGSVGRKASNRSKVVSQQSLSSVRNPSGLKTKGRNSNKCLAKDTKIHKINSADKVVQKAIRKDQEDSKGLVDPIVVKHKAVRRQRGNGSIQQQNHYEGHKAAVNSPRRFQMRKSQAKVKEVSAFVCRK
jgi:hypothetical protein